MKKKDKDILLQALENHLGIVSRACKASNIARITYYEWLKTDPEFAQKVEEVKESVLDFAEGSLYKSIGSGNVTATIFFLKNKGKSRGYQNEIDAMPNNTAPQKIEISILNPNKETDENPI